MDYKKIEIDIEEKNYTVDEIVKNLSMVRASSENFAKNFLGEENRENLYEANRVIDAIVMNFLEEKIKKVIL